MYGTGSLAALLSDDGSSASNSEFHSSEQCDSRLSEMEQQLQTEREERQRLVEEVQTEREERKLLVEQVQATQQLLQQLLAKQQSSTPNGDQDSTPTP